MICAVLRVTAPSVRIGFEGGVVDSAVSQFTVPATWVTSVKVILYGGAGLVVTVAELLVLITPLFDAWTTTV